MRWRPPEHCGPIESSPKSMTCPCREDNGMARNSMVMPSLPIYFPGIRCESGPKKPVELTTLQTYHWRLFGCRSAGLPGWYAREANPTRWPWWRKCESCCCASTPSPAAAHTGPSITPGRPPSSQIPNPTLDKQHTYSRFRGNPEFKSSYGLFE